MFTLTETNLPVEIQEAEYVRLLGYPKSRTLEGRSRELADGAATWFAENGRPWICAREVSPVELGEKKLRLGGTKFSSRRLHSILSEAEAHSVVLVAVSAGPECEEHARQLWVDDKPDEYFFLESYGSAVVEQLVVLASGRLCAWADTQGMAALPHFSPGYSGWNIVEQGILWDLFRQQFHGAEPQRAESQDVNVALPPHPQSLSPKGERGEALSEPSPSPQKERGTRGADTSSNLEVFPGPLEVLESGMLRPKKSLLTVFGLTRDLEKAKRFAKLIPCENCFLSDCRYRRAPFKRPMPRLESAATPECT